jgi:hypothetical protein
MPIMSSTFSAFWLRSVIRGSRANTAASSFWDISSIGCRSSHRLKRRGASSIRPRSSRGFANREKPYSRRRRIIDLALDAARAQGVAESVVRESPVPVFLAPALSEMSA